MSRHRNVPIFSHLGRFVVRWVRKGTLQDRVNEGEIVFHRSTKQYRLTPHHNELNKPTIWSPTSLTEADSYNLAGLNGSQSESAARRKLAAWASIYDHKALSVCAGKVHRP